MTELREIKPDIKDYWAFDKGLLDKIRRSIPEAEIAKFCMGCDSLTVKGGICRIAGMNDQARYVSRKWCGWTTVNKVRGQMTNEGFIPSKG